MDATKMVDADRFWELADNLVDGSDIVVDRPRGSRHPRYADFVYPIDYGYLAQTSTADGGGIDVWLGSLPERKVTGAIVTIDALKRDVEVKLLVGCTPDEAQRILALHNKGAQAGCLLWRVE